eukprot:5275297-Prymnesium_polylepis.1
MPSPPSACSELADWGRRRRRRAQVGLEQLEQLGVVAAARDEVGDDLDTLEPCGGRSGRERRGQRRGRVRPHGACGGASGGRRRAREA